MSNNITYNHDFLKQAGTGFLNYLDKLFAPMNSQLTKIDKFPIIIKNTGDEVFLTNMESSNETSDTLYQIVPRLTLDIAGISIQSGQLTNPWELGQFSAMNQDIEMKQQYVSNVRRIPINWTFNSEAVFSNVLEYLIFVEILLTVSWHNHYFTFIHNSKEYSGTFFLQEDLDSTVNLSLAFDTDKRNRKLPLTFVVELQYPAFNLYSTDDTNNIFGEVISAGDTMVKLIHNMHVDDTSEDGIVSTITVPDDRN